MNLCTERIKIVQLCTQAFTEQTSINGRVVYFLFNLVFIENERNEERRPSAQVSENKFISYEL